MIRNFAEVQEALRQYYNQPGSNTYTLDRIKELMTYLGNPQETLRIVHVAGTSGKTSTAYYVSSLLEQSGATVGLTVSPHVNEVNERVQINHAPLPETEFCKTLDAFLDIVRESGITPSYFELMVAFAFWQFARIGVDYAVVEVGLGGLLDGTNVITREDKVCVITDIGLDHTHILGNTITEIATQKAGIIHRSNHVFMLQQSVDAMKVVAAKCEQETAQLHVIEPWQASAPDALPLYQQRNFSLAHQAANYVLARDGAVPLTPEQIQAAATVYIPGRMEIHHIKGKIVIFDGAHNPQKMAAFISSVRDVFPDKDVAALIAFVHATADRWQPSLDFLARTCNHFVVSSFGVEQDHGLKQSVQVNEITAYLRSKHLVTLVAEPNLRKACESLLAQPEPVLLVTGSLYLLSSARRLMGVPENDTN